MSMCGRIRRTLRHGSGARMTRVLLQLELVSHVYEAPKHLYGRVSMLLFVKIILRGFLLKVENVSCEYDRLNG